MDVLTLVVFIATYVGLAVGRIPGLALDRTGFALLGGVFVVASGALDMEAFKDAVDVPTLAVLFGMMLLSAQYRVSGLYTAISDRVTAVRNPKRLLLAMILTTAALSAVLTNDVVCFALTPLLASSILRSGRDPRPYLIGLACASNIGSALTPIGNPQNILIAQSLQLRFLPFMASCAIPVALSLAFLYWILARRLGPERPPQDVTPADEARQPLDRWQALKAIALTGVIITLFLSPVPAHVSALVVGGILLLSRRLHTREMLGHVDWQLFVLFIGLFAVNRAFQDAGWSRSVHDSLAAAGLAPGDGIRVIPLIAVVSNLVSNVPAVMLFLPFMTPTAEAGTALALGSTLAGNAMIVSSIANVIVAEQAGRLGLRLGFREHARIGVPVTVFALVAAMASAALRP